MEMHAERSPRRTKSSAQLRFAHQAFMVLQRDIATCEVTGIEHIAAIPDEPYEVAVSHSTGFDVPMSVHALGRQLDLAVGDQSTHHSPKNEPGAYFWLHVCGKRNYLPISYEWRNGQKYASRFNPEDAEPMVRAIDKGKSVMVAAHSPLVVTRDGEAIPPRPGIFRRI